MIQSGRSFLPSRFLRAALAAAGAGLLAVSALAQELPEPPKQPWPEWLKREGLVMAGNWESLSYRLRAGEFARPGDEDTSAGIAAFERAYTPEMARKLKELGFNFVMLPLQKGLGSKAEARQAELTRTFAAICHRLGLHVGVYIGGTAFYEGLLEEYPDAEEWCLRGPDGQFIIYNWSDTNMYYRRRINQDHPGQRRRLRELTKFAIEELKADLIHLDNFSGGAPAYDAWSVKRFREFLAKKYTPEQRLNRFGFLSVDHVMPPIAPGPRAPAEFTDWPRDPLLRDFIDFRAWALADAYRELSEYAHRLKPDILMEVNVSGHYRHMSGTALQASDLQRLLPSGSAFWDEGTPSGLNPGGSMNSRFRSHMLGRAFGNMVFQYTSDATAMAESLALGLEVAGCAAHFESGNILSDQGEKGRPVPPEVFAYIRFFREHTALYRDVEPVADVGVINTFEDHVYSPRAARRHAQAVEQTLYQRHVPFTLVPGAYPGNLARFRAIVLADMYYLSPELTAALHTYVQNGGGLVLTGRAKGFADLFPRAPGKTAARGPSGKGRVAFIPEAKADELIDTVRWAAGGPFSVEVVAPETTAMACYRQPDGRQVLHLVNYDAAHPVGAIEISLAQPVKSATLLSPDQPATQRLEVQTRDGHTILQVPKLQTYSIVELAP